MLTALRGPASAFVPASGFVGQVDSPGPLSSTAFDFETYSGGEIACFVLCAN